MSIIEETVCSVRDTKNGASPLWCFGSTAIMRMGDTVYLTVPANDPDVLPLADRHIELYAKTGEEGFRRVWQDPRFTREPAPLLRRDGETLLVTLNPSAKDVPKGEGIQYGPAAPTLATFAAQSLGLPSLQPLDFGKEYCFTDHSYRGAAIDGETGDLFLTWQYVEEGEGKHCFLLRTQNGGKTGELAFPKRACYHNLAVRGGKAYVLAVSDVREPVEAWAAYKREKTGIAWDYDFRNLYFTVCDDIEQGRFGPVALIDSREDTCGLIRNLDVYVEEDGVSYVVYSARRIWHGFMRERFFPSTPFDTQLCLCAVKDGAVLWRKALDTETEQADGENTLADYGAAFFRRADGSVGLLVSKNGGNGSGLADGWHLSTCDVTVANGALPFAKLPISCPPGLFHTAKPRCGALPSDLVDVLANPGEDVLYIRISV